MSALDKLNKLREKLSPESMLMKTMGSFVPQLAEKIKEMEGPEGILKEGQDKVAYVITEHNGSIQLSVVPLTFDKELGKMIMDKPITTGGIETLLGLNKNAND